MVRPRKGSLPARRRPSSRCKAIEADPWNGNTWNKDILAIEQLIKKIGPTEPGPRGEHRGIHRNERTAMNIMNTTSTTAIVNAVVGLALVTNAVMAQQA